MKTTHRVARVVALVLAVALAAACTKSHGKEGESGSGGGTANPTPVVTGPPGTPIYRYDNGGG